MLKLFLAFLFCSINANAAIGLGRAVMFSGAAAGSGTTFTATGGTITDYGAYRVHTFTSDGTFTTNANKEFNVLYVAAGGPGGGYFGGGGGGGGVIFTTATVAAGTYSITIGTAAASRYQGGDTIVGFLPTRAHGGGRSASDNAVRDCTTGATGGGGYGSGGYTTGCPGTVGEGREGGNGTAGGSYGAGGGGGVDGPGDSWPPAVTSGKGGLGHTYDISGAAVCYGGGGTGAIGWTGVQEYGGCEIAGGGRGASHSLSDGSVISGYDATVGTANTGCGGGGGGTEADRYSMRAGGTGIVIIRYVR